VSARWGTPLSPEARASLTLLVLSHSIDALIRLLGTSESTLDKALSGGALQANTRARLEAAIRALEPKEAP
jgi:hypothetical protein